MKIGPAPLATDVLDERLPFVPIVTERGALAACGHCGATLQLVDGWADVRDMRHGPGCALGEALASVEKPVLFRWRQAETGGPSN